MRLQIRQVMLPFFAKLSQFGTMNEVVMFFPQGIEFRTSAAGGTEERKQSGSDAKNYLRNLSQCLKHISRICFSAAKRCCFAPADMVSIL
jgi:hypothetical protein